MSLPVPQLTLDFRIFFGEAAPANRLLFLDGMPKRELLAEISGLNYRLKPKAGIEYDTSYETQLKELERFTPARELRTKYIKTFNDYYDRQREKTAIIFSRQACLFALEEIAKSDLVEYDESFEMGRIEVWDAIVKYLLCVNEYITHVDAIDGEVTIEKLNPKLLPLNELSVAVDPIFLPYRGYKLLEYFAKHDKLGIDLQEYFDYTYGIGYKEFVHGITSMYMANKQGKSEFDFYYSIAPGSDTRLFDELSKSYDSAETIKLVRSRKYPFAKINAETYFLLDNVFLLEKVSSQFVHDFWFDWLKNILADKDYKYNISFYKSIYGYFTEQYVSHWVNFMFKARANYKIFCFEELKVVNGAGAEIELADLYIRSTNKILIGQVKSGSIYDNQKFGGDVEILYKSNRDKFFENFGVNQLVGSITQIDQFMSGIDKGFSKGRKYEIYPCLIVSDKVFQTPVMADVFNTRFQEMIAEKDFGNMTVHPLTLLHISDLERMAVKVSKRPKYIWELLAFNFRMRSFIPPFYNTLNIKFQGREYPEEVVNLYKELIDNYSVKT